MDGLFDGVTKNSGGRRSAPIANAGHPPRHDMHFDPAFYWIAIPAVLITGLSKGGIGGGISMLGTPMLALAVAPVTAAAIMLPVLLVMDAVGLLSYRGAVKWSVVRSLMPGALSGIGLGWATAAFTDPDILRVLLGVIAIVFAVNQAFADWMKRQPRRENAVAATIWGVAAGYSSFVSHAGGPPYQAYTVPLKIDKVLYAGTTVVFFAIINAVKVVPYLALGQFNASNLGLSLTLLPVAVIGVMLGVWAVRRVSQEVFYKITYAAMFLIGGKLIWDGTTALLSAG
jgi:uncharacterized membrane protein YfcA